jgi:hypothetical protein
MKLIRGIGNGCCSVTAILMFTMALCASAQPTTTLPIGEDQVVYQMIGEFLNSGAAHMQYGYFTSVAGLNSVFSSPTTKDESTALVTFVTTATNTQVVNHGPFRIVNRAGTTTIYLNNGPSSFADPASFSQGTPIQKSNFTQQVILNTSTNAFVTVHTNTVTSVRSFTLGGTNYRLGNPGKSFRTNYSGQANAPGVVPSGYFAGTSTGSKN